MVTKWLHKALESYAAPQLIRELAECEKYCLRPVFRDRDDLGASPSISNTLQAAIENSESLIVICSPATRKSSWVNKEIESFIAAHGRERIFCVIVEGDPSHVFPEILLDGPEPLAADLRKEHDGKRDGLLKLIAGLLEVSYDTLRQRESRRRNHRYAVTTALSIVGMVLTSGLASWAFIAESRAIDARIIAETRRSQAENLLSFMVGDLRSSLEPLGKLDLLDRVGEKAIDYYDKALETTISDSELATKSKILSQLGEISVAKFEYQDALSLFLQANQLSTSLVGRQPKSAQNMFERSQSEFWVGYVYWRNGSLSKAESWLTKYRDTAKELVDIQPDNHQWQQEIIYAEHNLGVLLLEKKDYLRAYTVFQNESRLHQARFSLIPDDYHILEDLADAYSWQGVCQERLGKLENALDLQIQSREVRNQVLELSSENKHSELWLAVAYGNEAMAYSHLGKVQLADDRLSQALSYTSRLTKLDPNNKQWLRYHLSLQVNQFELARSPILSKEINPLEIENVTKNLLILHAAEDADRRAATLLVKAYRIKSELVSASHPELSVDALKNAFQIVKSQCSNTRQDPDLLAELLRLHNLSLQLRYKIDIDKECGDIVSIAKLSTNHQHLEPLVRNYLIRNLDPTEWQDRLQLYNFQPIVPWISTKF